MDWHSRYVLSWKVTLTLDAAFCVEALEEALAVGIPEIFNADQGSQFTSKDFTKALKNVCFRHSLLMNFGSVIDLVDGLVKARHRLPQLQTLHIVIFLVELRIVVLKDEVTLCSFYDNAMAEDVMAHHGALELPDLGGTPFRLELP